MSKHVCNDSEINLGLAATGNALEQPGRIRTQCGGYRVDRAALFIGQFMLCIGSEIRFGIWTGCRSLFDPSRVYPGLGEVDRTCGDREQIRATQSRPCAQGFEQSPFQGGPRGKLFDAQLPARRCEHILPLRLRSNVTDTPQCGGQRNEGGLPDRALIVVTGKADQRKCIRRQGLDRQNAFNTAKTGNGDLRLLRNLEHQPDLAPLAEGHDDELAHQRRRSRRSIVEQ